MISSTKALDIIQSIALSEGITIGRGIDTFLMVSTGEIELHKDHDDAVMNISYLGWSPAYEVLACVAHELGHYLSVKDSPRHAYRYWNIRINPDSHITSFTIAEEKRAWKKGIQLLEKLGYKWGKKSEAYKQWCISAWQEELKRQQRETNERN